MTLMPGRPLSRIGGSPPLPFLSKLARAIRSLHHATLPESNIARLSRDYFPKFLEERLTKVYIKHEEWGSQPYSLPLRFVEQFESFLPKKGQFDRLLSDPSSYVLVHGDLHGSNILVTTGQSGTETGTEIETETEGKELHIGGIIDLGDALVGDPLFDFVPLYSFVLRFDKRLLKQFLVEYGLWTQIIENMEGLDAKDMQ